MKKIDWRDAAAIAVIMMIIATICTLGLRPLTIGLALAFGMICVYVVMLAIFGQGRCIEMGIAAIILAVLTIQIIGLVGSIKHHNQLKTKPRVEPTAAASPSVSSQKVDGQ